MTVALVGQTVGQVAAISGTTVTLPGTMGKAGDLIIALVGRSGGLSTGALTGVTDSGGNTWTLATRGSVSGGSNTRLECWYTVLPANITTVTFSSGTSQIYSWNVNEWSGMTATPIDVTSTDNSGVASSTAIATPSITTSTAGDLVIAAVQSAFVTSTLNLGGSSPTTGWTSLTGFDNGSTTSGDAAYIVDATTGARNTAWTLATAHAAGVLTVAFRALVDTAFGRTYPLVYPRTYFASESDGTATPAVALTASATATWIAPVPGTGANTVSITAFGTAISSPVSNGTASGTASLAATATASVTAPGTVARTVSLATTATASVTSPATVARAVSLSATGAGSWTGAGTSSGSVTSAVGLTATSTATWTGAGTSNGTASRTVTLTSSVTGSYSVTASGTVARTSTVTSSATGSTVIPQSSGTAARAVGVAGVGGAYLTGVGKPVPLGRGRWRLTLHRRQFSDVGWQSTLIAELPHATGRRLDQQLNGSAQLSFTLDGHDQEASLVQELQHDVCAWRWDEASGQDICYFRGIVAQSEDQISEQSHVVTFTCHDYLAMLGRRVVTYPLTYTGIDQDDIVNDFMVQVKNIQATVGTGFLPGSYLPIAPAFVNPAGANRGRGGTVSRDRSYPGSSKFDEMFDQLAHVIGGYDYDVVPGWRYPSQHTDLSDWLRIFYPSQGISRTLPVLEYGGSVTSLTRTIASSEYANFERILGSDATVYSERWNADSNNVTVAPVGLWMDAQNSADVSVYQTLDQQADGLLALNGTITPSYTLKLTPGTYADGLFNMGDTLPLVIQSGRLNVNASIRIMAISFSIGDDGQEDVEVTVGRSTTTLGDILSASEVDINALARR